MIELLAVLITLITVAGVGILIEQATGVYRFLRAWVHTLPRPWAPPHAKAEADETKEETCNYE